MLYFYHVDRGEMESCVQGERKSIYSLSSDILYKHYGFGSRYSALLQIYYKMVIINNDIIFEVRKSYHRVLLT